jgi:SAM-dependent methyltransferase
VTAPHAELTAAYEGLEASFADEAARDAYRATMLARSAEQADLLLPALEMGTVLEIGCAARSRIEFARRWSEDLRLASLRFEVADALEMTLAPAGYDAILCITGAFAYFEPLAAGTALVLARRWAQALRPGGLLVLELYPHPELVRVLAAAGGSVRLWRELDPDDPWRFYLSDLQVDHGVLISEDIHPPHERARGCRTTRAASALLRGGTAQPGPFSWVYRHLLSRGLD